MSFVNNTLRLPNSYIKSNQPLHQFKECGKCKEKRPPEGGVQMNREKWLCARCWTARMTKPATR